MDDGCLQCSVHVLRCIFSHMLIRDAQFPIVTHRIVVIIVQLNEAMRTCVSIHCSLAYPAKLPVARPHAHWVARTSRQHCGVSGSPKQAIKWEHSSTASVVWYFWYSRWLILDSDWRGKTNNNLDPTIAYARPACRGSPGSIVLQPRPGASLLPRMGAAHALALALLCKAPSRKRWERLGAEVQPNVSWVSYISAFFFSFQIFQIHFLWQPVTHPILTKHIHVLDTVNSYNTYNPQQGCLLAFHHVCGKDSPGAISSTSISTRKHGYNDFGQNGHDVYTDHRSYKRRAEAHYSPSNKSKRASITPKIAYRSYNDGHLTRTEERDLWTCECYDPFSKAFNSMKSITWKTGSIATNKMPTALEVSSLVV